MTNVNVAIRLSSSDNVNDFKKSAYAAADRAWEVFSLIVNVGIYNTDIIESEKHDLTIYHELEHELNENNTNRRAIVLTDLSAISNRSVHQFNDVIYVPYLQQVRWAIRFSSKISNSGIIGFLYDLRMSGSVLLHNMLSTSLYASNQTNSILTLSSTSDEKHVTESLQYLKQRGCDVVVVSLPIRITLKTDLKIVLVGQTSPKSNPSASISINYSDIYVELALRVLYSRNSSWKSLVEDSIVIKYNNVESGDRIPFIPGADQGLPNAESNINDLGMFFLPEELCDEDFYFNKTNGEINCIACDVGYSYNGSNCSPCPEGQSTILNSKYCSLCDEGYFNQINGGQCLRCSDNTVSSERGSLSCQGCFFGMSSNDKHTACQIGPILIAILCSASLIVIIIIILVVRKIIKKNKIIAEYSHDKICETISQSMPQWDLEKLAYLRIPTAGKNVIKTPAQKLWITLVDILLLYRPFVPQYCIGGDMQKAFPGIKSRRMSVYKVGRAARKSPRHSMVSNLLDSPRMSLCNNSREALCAFVLLPNFLSDDDEYQQQVSSAVECLYSARAYIVRLESDAIVTVWDDQCSFQKAIDILKDISSTSTVICTKGSVVANIIGNDSIKFQQISGPPMSRLYSMKYVIAASFVCDEETSVLINSNDLGVCRYCGNASKQGTALFDVYSFANALGFNDEGAYEVTFPLIFFRDIVDARSADNGRETTDWLVNAIRTTLMNVPDHYRTGSFYWQDKHLKVEADHV